MRHGRQVLAYLDPSAMALPPSPIARCKGILCEHLQLALAITLDHGWGTLGQTVPRTEMPALLDVDE